ncbi:MAG: hypothetical protein JKY55_05000 [Aliivibrio sp.]|uniref:DUF6731 family protein n=1 Tax=Aliivibrio sp. TaxID=1872443 RepID=UPI001A641EBE|nr:hypothetical protein [Aliivibrio sp.]
MTSKITIRFYSVEKMNPNGLSLKQALEQIDGVADHSERQQQVTAGSIVRLERYAEDAGELAGEFTRVRNENFPFEVKDDGVDPLATGGLIGDGVAFRYRPSDHTLAMQYDARIVSPGRAMDYLMLFDRRGTFQITPKMDVENWHKFQAGGIRKIRIGIASPDHLGEIEQQGASVVQSFRELGAAYEAPVITIEMGMGNKRGALADSAKGLARAISAMAGIGGADLRSLKATIKPDDDSPAEEINLIDEVLSDKSEIALPRNDPDQNYELRRDWLKERLRQHGNN